MGLHRRPARSHPPDAQPLAGRGLRGGLPDLLTVFRALWRRELPIRGSGGDPPPDRGGAARQRRQDTLHRLCRVEATVAVAGPGLAGTEARHRRAPPRAETRRDRPLRPRGRLGEPRAGGSDRGLPGGESAASADGGRFHPLHRPRCRPAARRVSRHRCHRHLLRRHGAERSRNAAGGGSLPRRRAGAGTAPPWGRRRGEAQQVQCRRRADARHAATGQGRAGGRSGGERRLDPPVPCDRHPQRRSPQARPPAPPGCSDRVQAAPRCRSRATAGPCAARRAVVAGRYRSARRAGRRRHRRRRPCRDHLVTDRLRSVAARAERHDPRTAVLCRLGAHREPGLPPPYAAHHSGRVGRGGAHRLPALCRSADGPTQPARGHHPAPVGGRPRPHAARADRRGRDETGLVSGLAPPVAAALRGEGSGVLQAEGVLGRHGVLRRAVAAGAVAHFQPRALGEIEPRRGRLDGGGETLLAVIDAADLDMRHDRPDEGVPELRTRRPGLGPETVEGALEGHALDVVDGRAEGHRRYGHAHRPQADRAVHGDAALRGIEHDREVTAIHEIDPARHAVLGGGAADDPRPVAHRRIKRMGLDDESRIRRCVLGEGGDHGMDRRLEVVIRRIGTQLEVVLHLQGQHVIRCLVRLQLGDETIDPRRSELSLQDVQARAEIDERRMIDLVRAVEWEQEPQPVAEHVVGDVPHDLCLEAVLETRLQIRLRQVLGQRHHRLGFTGETAVPRHAVTLQRDPIRPEIAEIGHGHVEVAGLRRRDRNLVVETLLAQKHQVGDALAVDQIRNEGGPFLPAAPIIDGARAAPEQHVADAEVHAQAAMAPRLQFVRRMSEVGRDRPLKEQEDLPSTPSRAARAGNVLRRGGDRSGSGDRCHESHTFRACTVGAGPTPIRAERRRVLEACPAVEKAAASWSPLGVTVGYAHSVAEMARSPAPKDAILEPASIHR